MSNNLKIGEATQLYEKGRLTIGDLQHWGNRKEFWPIFIDGEAIPTVLDGNLVKGLNPISVRVNGPAIPARKELIENNEDMSDWLLLGLICGAWSTYCGPDKDKMAQHLQRMLGNPDQDGNITLTFNVGPHLATQDTGANGTGE